jgi:hypothetical protein
VSTNPKTKLAPLPVDTLPAWRRESGPYLVARAALDGVDALAHELEKKWGFGRLRRLVDETLRARFDSQRLKLNHATRHGELADVQREAGRMKNAWAAMHAAAIASGAEHIAPVVWEGVTPDGVVIAVVQTDDDARSVIAEGRQLEVYTMQEIANLVHAFPSIARAKEVFPGATVERVKLPRDPLEAWEANGDAIPFGPP